MAFWVNEDKGNNSAITHRDDCPHGAPNCKKEQNGRWYGPYDTENEAMQVARNTGRKIAKVCTKCKPRTNSGAGF